MCKRLWTEETVTHHGEFFSFDEVVFEPKPVQRPRPPILVGGESKAALRPRGPSRRRLARHGPHIRVGATQIELLRGYLAGTRPRAPIPVPDRARGPVSRATT